LKFAGSFDGNMLSALNGEIVQQDGLQLLGCVDLYHRDELSDQLGIRHVDLNNYSDVVLVLLAYKKWGKNFFQYLYGAWSFVLCDVDNKVLLLSRDPSENSSLFYLFKGHTLFFSSFTTFFNDNALFDLEIDRDEFIRLSLRLVGNSRGKTIIKELHNLCPQSFLICDAEMHIESVEFLQEVIPVVRFKKEKDYFLQFRSLMAEAVMCRLRGANRPGIFLSSGLDSTTVCSFLLKSSDPGKIIHTYTSVPNFIDEHDNLDSVSEQPLVEYFLKKFLNVKSSFLQFPNALLDAQFKNADILNLFNPIIHSNSFWLKGILEQARSDGVDRMFTGQMGNYSISFKGHQSSFSLSISRWMHYIFSMLFGDYHFKKQQWKYSVIRDDLISSLSKSKSFKAEFKLGYNHSLCTSTFRKKAFKKNHRFASVQWSLLGHEFGIRVVDPTCDIRLMNFLDSIPSTIFNRKGISKYLLKQAMLGILPSRILFNRIPKPQSADIGKRLERENFLSDIVDNLFDKYKNSNFFDVRKLKAIHVQLMATGNKQQQHVLSFHLLYMISMINCYDQLHGARA
jgi:asparagine synthase (glutamine-hydrolysing)